MAQFIKLDPTSPVTSINLANYGYEVGDSLIVGIVGAFKNGEEYPDIYSDTTIQWDGGSFRGYLYQIQITLEETTVVAIYNNDFPLEDNTDPNGDWGFTFRPTGAPIAAEDGSSGFMTEKNMIFNTESVLLNDSDPDGDVLFVESFDIANTTGIVTYNGDGTFRYDPNGNFDFLAPGDLAYDTFEYTVSDGALTDSAIVTVTITNFISLIPEEIRSLYENSTNLSDEAKDYLDMFFQESVAKFGDLDDNPLLIQLALKEATDLREIAGNSVDSDLRDAEYYLHGLYASSNGDVPHGIAAAGTPAYNAYKGLAKFFGLQDYLRSNSSNPNSDPGGAAAAREGLLDGLSIDAPEPDHSVPFMSPQSESFDLL